MSLGTDSTVSIACRRLQGLSTADAEQCSLSLSSETCVVLLEGRRSLVAHPVDEIDGILAATTTTGTAVVVLRTSEGYADMVVELDTSAEADLVTSELEKLRTLRQSRGAVTLPKLIVWAYMKDRVELAAVLCTDGISRVKWSKGLPAEWPVFPHTRLDFLRLHLNRSVLQKLTSNGDRSIQLTCDNVTLFWSQRNKPPHGGAPFTASSTASTVAGGAVGMYSPEEASTMTCTEIEELLKRHGMSGIVLILTERSLYATKATGAVVGRAALDDVTVIKFHTMLNCGNELTETSHGSGTAGSSAAASHGILLGLRDDSWLVLQSRYAKEVDQRVRAYRAAAQQRSAVPSREQQQQPNYNHLTSLSTRGTQTDGFALGVRGAGRGAAGGADDASLAGTPGEYLMRSRMAQLEEALVQRDATIALLQQRVELLVKHSANGDGGGAGIRGSRDFTTPTTSSGRTSAAVGKPHHAAVSSHVRTVEQENDILRHYASLLEHRLAAVEHEQRCSSADAVAVEVTDGGALSSAGAVVELQAAFVRCVESERQKDETIARLNREMEEVTKSFQRSLQEIHKKSVSMVQEYLKKHPAGATLPSASSSTAAGPAPGSANIGSPSVTPMPVPPEMKRLQQINRQLLEELAERESLLEELARSEGLDGAAGSSKVTHASLQRLEQLTNDAAQAEMTVRALHEERDALARELQTLKSERSLLIEGGAFEKKLLSAIGSLTLQATRVASLEVLLTNQAARHRDALLFEERWRASDREVASLRSQLSAATAKLKRTTPAAVAAVDAPPTVSGKAATNVGPSSKLRRSVTPRDRRQGTAAALSPSPRATSIEVTRIVSQSPVGSKRLSVSPGRTDTRLTSSSPRSPATETRKLQRELEQQRTAFERRLQDLEMVAMMHTTSRNAGSDDLAAMSMGVVQPPAGQSPRATRRLVETQELVRRPTPAFLDRAARRVRL